MAFKLTPSPSHQKSDDGNAWGRQHRSRAHRRRQKASFDVSNEGSSAHGKGLGGYNADAGHRGRGGAPGVFSAQPTDFKNGRDITLPDGFCLGGAEAGASPFLNPGVQNIKAGNSRTLDYVIKVEIPNLPVHADVVFLQDLSGSFRADLPNVRAQFSNLYDTLNADGRDVAFGVTSFVDRPVKPFGRPGDYVYTTNQIVSTDKSLIQASLENLDIFSGRDAPESQLDALLQLALRGSEIGWRANTRRFVLVLTDSGYHQAGDSNGFANNNNTSIEPGEDYASVAQVRTALENAGITPIFAVTAPNLEIYRGLVGRLGRGQVVKLSSNSDNFSESLLKALRDQIEDLRPVVMSDEYDFVKAVTPTLYRDLEGGESLEFKVSLVLPSSYANDEVLIDFGPFGQHRINLDVAGPLIGTKYADRLVGNNGDNVIEGRNGCDFLDGKGGKDLLIGGGGADRMRGGNDDDTFLMSKNAGKDLIEDFVSGDTVKFSRSTGLLDFDDVVSAMSQHGADVQIVFAGGRLTMQNVSVDELNSSNFAFF